MATVSENAAAAAQTVKFARFPNNQLGLLLDHGAASAYAIHLIAFKRLHADGYVLNEHLVAKPVSEGGIGIGEKKFRQGLTLAKRQEVLDRRKGGRRPNGKTAFAREKLAPGGDGYVKLPEALVRSRDSKLLAFVAATLLEPFPRDARDIAKRIGVSTKSPNSIRRLVEVAAAGQHIAAEHVGMHWIVARPGFNLVGFKRVGIQKVGIEKVAIHSKLQDDHSRQQERAQEPASEALCEGTRPGDAPRALAFEKDDLKIASATKKELGPEWTVLTDWTCSKFWRERRAWYAFNGKIEFDRFRRKSWQHSLDYYGGAPGYLATDNSHRQAVEIAHELSHTLSINDPGRVLRALAFWVCKAVAEGRRINSLGLIAEQLVRRCDAGDDDWLWALPFRMEPKAVEEAQNLVDQAMPALENAGITINRRVLASTIEVEELARMLKTHGWNGVVAGINAEIRDKAQRLGNNSICGWHWFDNAIEATKERKASDARAAAKSKSEAIARDLEAWEAGRRRHEAERAARMKMLRSVADAGIAQLRAAGIDVDEQKLTTTVQLDYLFCRTMGQPVSIGDVLPAAIAKWLAAPTRTKVSAWSNIGAALIRAEIAAIKARAAA